MWLSPAFESWSLVPLLGQLRGPVLAVQGHEDVYGTMAQIDLIAQHAPHTQTCKLTPCGHSPHKDQPRALLDAALAWLK